ncbi:MAG: peptidylprolyl isomerase [Kiloniellaceae bacterium]
MSQAALGDTVRVHYRGTFDDGSEFDSSLGRDPITVTIGGGQYIPGFEDALLGMTAGDNKTITIAAEDAFGPYRTELVQEIDRAQIPPEMNLEVEGSVFVRGPDGQPMRLTVKELTDVTVTLDANHPLAGKALIFELELVEIL